MKNWLLGVSFLVVALGLTFFLHDKNTTRVVVAGHPGNAGLTSREGHENSGETLRRRPIDPLTARARKEDLASKYLNAYSAIGNSGVTLSPQAIEDFGLDEESVDFLQSEITKLQESFQEKVRTGLIETTTPENRKDDEYSFRVDAFQDEASKLKGEFVDKVSSRLGTRAAETVGTAVEVNPAFFDGGASDLLFRVTKVYDEFAEKDVWKVQYETADPQTGVVGTFGLMDFDRFTRIFGPILEVE
jgi:hypothetical protein